MKKILFVCSANKDRSKTAEDYFSEQYDAFEFKSSGTNLKLCRQLGTQPVTEELFEWADLIIAMEEKHREFIKKTFPNNDYKKIEILHLPDRFLYYQKELIETLRLKAEPILNRL